MLCSDGSVYSCGRNDSGQLGHGDAIDKKTPQSVLNCPRGIVSISCGQFHTVAATSSGSVFVCGKNDFGQLGLENTNMVKVFAELPSHPEIESVVQVCCGYYHTLLLSNTGIVAGFGRNDYGQVNYIFFCFIIRRYFFLFLTLLLFIYTIMYLYIVGIRTCTTESVYLYSDYRVTRQRRSYGICWLLPHCSCYY